MVYYFGIYHWRERARSLLVALSVLGFALWIRSRRRSRFMRGLCLLVAGRALFDVGETLSSVFGPPPWRVERYKYDALATRLPLGEADRVLDVGCGTGRSLVCLSPHLSEATTLLGLDVFDDRVILGNGPALARRNASLAGFEATPVRGDGARLPFATDRIDVLTACRVLHDLPAAAADRALEEFGRVCVPDGRIGVLELPLTPEGIEAGPEAYWRERALAAGLEIERCDRIDRRGTDGQYVVLVARPA